MKIARLALVLAFAFVNASSRADTIWPEVGGGGGGSDNLGNHIATQDIALGLNQVDQAPAIDFNATLTDHETGAGPAPFWRRYAESGPPAVCEVGAPNAGAACTPLAVNSAQCGGAHDCIRNTATTQVPITFGLDAIGTTGAFALDPIVYMRYNAGADGQASSPQVAGHAWVGYHREFDWRPSNADEDRQLIEEYIQVIPPNGSASQTWRPYFDGVNATQSSAVHQWLAGSFVGDTGRLSPLGAMTLGGFETYPQPGLRIASDQTVPFAGFQVEFSSNQGGHPAGGWDSTSVTPHFHQMASLTQHATNDNPTQAQTALAITSTADGPNIFGACDANSTGASVSEGDRCVMNEDCNDGAAYSGSNGICVKGNGTLGTGTNDGLCIVTATKAVSAATVFCDSTFEAQGTCATGEVCRDIQEFYPLKTITHQALVVEANTAPVSGSLATFGYCSSGSGGSADDEGKLCRENADCSSNVCTFQTNGARHVESIVASTVRQKFTDSRTVNLADPTIFNGTYETLSGYGEINEFQLSANNQNIIETTRLFFASPTVAGSGNTIASARGLHFADQWGSSVYRPALIGWDTLTAASGGNSAINGASFGWNTGKFHLGRIDMWSEAEGTSPGTVDNLRVSFNSTPGSATAGQAVAVHSLSNNHGLMKWGVSDASGSANFDTGTEVCAATGQTCVDSDVMGSDGSATTCSTAHANAANFWAFCRD